MSRLRRRRERITTTNRVAGFASLDDVNGNDWIGYHPTPGSGSAGEYRGIPNLGAVGHPGYVNSSSTLVSQGPLKATIQSQSTDGAWRFMWEIYPNYATMTLQQAGGNYWLLYEGTPGGTFEPASDSWTRSSGETLLCSQNWTGDMANPEWVYFRDGARDRYLFMAHHEDDALEDQYWQMENNMTVFGFGRQYPCCDKYLTAVPAHLTIGLGRRYGHGVGGDQLGLPRFECGDRPGHPVAGGSRFAPVHGAAGEHERNGTQSRGVQRDRDGDGAVGVSMAARWCADQRGDGQQLHVEPDGGGF